MSTTLTLDIVKSDSLHEYPVPLLATYVDAFWLPIAGPSVIAAARTIRFLVTEDVTEISFADLAACCGSKPSRFRPVLDRANRMRFVQFIPATGRLAVYDRVRLVKPSVLPAPLRGLHP